jgi:two-component system OmpR family sensor kinase
MTDDQARTAEERRRFLRRLDHELKNPLTAIQVALANLAETDDFADRRKIHASIQTQIQRLTDLVGNLRKLAELETGPIEYLPVDIPNLLHEVMVAAQEHPDGDDRQIDLALPVMAEHPPVVMGDRDLLLLALYNVVDNAIKFTAPGDTIMISARPDGAAMVIEVSDTGSGIPKADLPHVWEELYRSKEIHAVPGSGIGLAMVKTIVERHRGKVDLQSERGSGTVVEMRLPIADATQFGF